MKMNHGGQIVKLRAFVAGTGDMRRVQTIVSEVFADKKLPLPALSTVQVGALPMEGAQVAMESISMDKKPVHARGLVFFAGQKGADSGAAVSALERSATAAGVSGAGMLRVTCFLSSLEQTQSARDAIARAFPSAAANLVQALRASAESAAVCEGVGDRFDGGDAIFLSASAAKVSTAKLVFSGTQMAFRDQEADLRLAYQRLQRALEPLGVSYRDVVFTSTYPLTKGVAERFAAIGAEFFPREVKAPGTTLLFEGLPSLDASIAIEVVAAASN
jgi:enamine deaminase RidA (YjgF/YER057c/UK114 family)